MAIAQAVRRDTHKMKAFVRFREVPGQPDAFIAWFEPQHHIVDRVAPFFARRFTGMRWAILTLRAASPGMAGACLRPRCTARRPGRGCARVAVADLLRQHLQSGPAQHRMMMQEMPAKVLAPPAEAQLLPRLVRDAADRVQECMTGRRRHRSAGFPCVRTLRRRHRCQQPGESARQASACRQCPLWEQATQTVFGQGPADAG
jgi:DNA polymerase